MQLIRSMSGSSFPDMLKLDITPFGTVFAKDIVGLEGKSTPKPREIQQRPARIEVRLALCIMVGALI